MVAVIWVSKKKRGEENTRMPVLSAAQEVHKRLYILSIHTMSSHPPFTFFFCAFPSQGLEWYVKVRCCKRRALAFCDGKAGNK